MLIKVIKDSIVYRGEIKALGDNFDCDDAIAKSLIERGFASPTDEQSIERVEETEEPIEETEESNDISQYSYQELKKMASSMGLSAKGSKEDLIERISANEVAEIEDDEETEELPNTSMPE